MYVHHQFTEAVLRGKRGLNVFNTKFLIIYLKPGPKYMGHMNNSRLAKVDEESNNKDFQLHLARPIPGTSTNSSLFSVSLEIINHQRVQIFIHLTSIVYLTLSDKAPNHFIPLAIPASNSQTSFYGSIYRLLSSVC